MWLQRFLINVTRSYYTKISRWFVTENVIKRFTTFAKWRDFLQKLNHCLLSNDVK